MTAADLPHERQYHKGNVAEDLITVATRILEMERVENLSVRRLSREVGVSPPNFYNHFSSLNDLLLTIAAAAFYERSKLIGHIRRTSKTRAEALKRSMLSLVEFASGHHQIFRIMFGHIPDADQHDGYRNASDASFGQVAELIYGREVYDPRDLHASHENAKLAYGWFAMSYGLARIVVERQFKFPGKDERAETQIFVESLVDAFVSGEMAKLFS